MIILKCSCGSKDLRVRDMEPTCMTCGEVLALSCSACGEIIEYEELRWEEIQEE